VLWRGVGAVGEGFPCATFPRHRQGVRREIAGARIDSRQLPGENITGMIDQILSWFVVFAPFLLSIIFIFIPSKSEDRAVHMRWRIALVAFGLTFSVVAWIQQTRATKAAAAQISSAIESTASSTSVKTAAGVAGELNGQYGAFIKKLYERISDLEGQARTQSTLRKNEYQLNFTPAADLVYAGDQLQLWNRGRTSLSLWGVKYGNEAAFMFKVPSVVGVTDSVGLLTNIMKPRVLASLGANGQDTVPVEFYVGTGDQKKYVKKCNLIETTKDSVLTVLTQCQEFEPRDWSKQQ
jgi:hypothetical protein